ncbi:MAG: group II intron reverse transcriptase/maturase [Gammaproteobacteria bacterium]
MKNRGAAGVDDISIEMFHAEHKQKLYQLWNRMSSGSYFPPPVKTVVIPKKLGGERSLGIPTVADRVAQTVVKLFLEPLIEPQFDNDSYGYRPKKSALDAVAQARQRCWKRQWVIDLDIQGFFDNIDHELVMRAVLKHTSCQWVRLYVKRWLQADIHQPDGTVVKRVKGTPQGGVISPLLANVFLHYVFDLWMRKHHPNVLFERYADDILMHCQTKREAEKILQIVKERLTACKLTVNAQKTQIVYCGTAKIKDDVKRSFDFLGYTFRPRLAQSKAGKRFVGILPAVSEAAKKNIRRTVKEWQLHHRISETIESLAQWINPYLRGWVNYYGKFYRSELGKPMLQVEHYLIRWIQRKYKKSTGSLGIRAALRYLGQVRKYKPYLFEHWRQGWIWSTD